MFGLASYYHRRHDALGIENRIQAGPGSVAAARPLHPLLGGFRIVGRRVQSCLVLLDGSPPVTLYRAPRPVRRYLYIFGSSRFPRRFVASIPLC